MYRDPDFVVYWDADSKQAFGLCGLVMYSTGLCGVVMHWDADSVMYRDADSKQAFRTVRTRNVFIRTVRTRNVLRFDNGIKYSLCVGGLLWALLVDT